MADTLTPAQRRKCMAAIHGKDTTPERIVRSALHRLGCRFALHRTDLPGKPDIVMPARGLIVLVHGCYWHMHSCKRGRSTPATNAAFWKTKRTRTRERDRRTAARLRRAGWRVLVIWECHTRDTALLAKRLSSFLFAQRHHAATVAAATSLHGPVSPRVLSERRALYVVLPASAVVNSDCRVPRAFADGKRNAAPVGGGGA